MSAQGGSATNVVQLNAAGRREAKIVAAARVVSIDYRSIVDNAVAGLTNNTPDARREVYAQARGIVKRHLQLMRLPEPIVEVEKLALDITIRKIERQWRSRQAAEKAIPDPEVPEQAKVERVTAREAAGSLAQALAALGAALASLLIVLGLRPILTIILAVARPLRFLISPVSLAATLPIVAMAIFFIFFVDNKIAYKSLIDGPAGRWLSRLDIVPAAPAPRNRTKEAERAPSVVDTRARAAPEPVRLGEQRPAVAQAAVADASPVRSPTRVRPVAAELAEVPAAPPAAPARAPAAIAPAPVPARAPAPIAAPPPEASAAPTASLACGSGLSISERIACAASDLDAVAEAPARSGRDAQPPPPAWLDDYATMNGVAVGRPPSAGAPASGEETAVALASTAPATDGAPDSDDAAPIVVMPGDPPRPAPAAPRGPLIKPANAKVTALVDSGKRAAVKGDLDRAVHDFSEAIRIDPKYPDSYSERGQAMFKLGETERAIADYTAAIKRDPQHGSALRSRGMAYLYRGTPDLALADLTKAIELAENDPSLMAPIELFYARRSRASILGGKQQYDREIADYTSLVESYMSDPMVVEALKANYGDVGAANILATVYRQRATAHIRKQSWDLAIADLTEAIPLSSDNGYTALVDRSKLYEGLGQREPAIADLQSALGVRPGSEEVRLALRRMGATSKPAAPIRGL